MRSLFGNELIIRIINLYNFWLLLKVLRAVYGPVADARIHIIYYYYL